METESKPRGKRRHRTAALTVALVIFCFPLLFPPTNAMIAAPSFDGSGRRPGGPAVVHGTDGMNPRKSGASTKVFSVGRRAIEPTLGLDPGGNIFYAAAGFEGPGDLVPGTQVMRSEDRGRTWEVVSPRVLGQNTMPITGDPYVYVDDRIDGDSARVFTIDLTLACSYMSFSDDKGETWITNPLSCGRPINDHQTLFSGPPVASATAGYPNIVYYCWNDVGTSSCSKSLDGGITFVPTGEPAFLGYESSNRPGFYGIDGFCGGLHGHGVVDAEGTVYLPREQCGRPMLAISRDEGQSWERVEVSDIASTAQPEEGASHPSVAVDEAGNLFYLWIGSEDRNLYLTVSRDGGRTWSKARRVAAPGVKEATLPQIEAAGKGKIALVYYGSTNSPFQACEQDCTEADYQYTTWNGYLTISTTALDKEPRFVTGYAGTDSDPLVIGRCGPGACQWALDFIDVEIGPDGIGYGAFVDSCIQPCHQRYPSGEYEGLTVKIVGGPLLS